MPTEFIAAGAALLGTLVGGFVNYFASRSMKTREWQLAIKKDSLQSRQKLYADFLVTTQTLIMKSMEARITKPTDLDIMNVEFARIELLGSARVVEAAREICDHVIVAHSERPESDKRSFFILKQEFIRAAREELGAACAN